MAGEYRHRCGCPGFLCVGLVRLRPLRNVRPCTYTHVVYWQAGWADAECFPQAVLAWGACVGAVHRGSEAARTGESGDSPRLSTAVQDAAASCVGQSWLSRLGTAWAVSTLESRATTGGRSRCGGIGDSGGHSLVGAYSLPFLSPRSQANTMIADRSETPSSTAMSSGRRNPVPEDGGRLSGTAVAEPVPGGWEPDVD